MLSGLLGLITNAIFVLGIAVLILRCYYRASHRRKLRKALEDRSFPLSPTLDILFAEELPRWLRWLTRVKVALS
jgi:hypothetical protein